MKKLQLSDEMYLRFRDLLKERAGLNYPEHRRDDLVHGLAQVLGASDYSSLESLYQDATTSGAGWDLLLTYLTVGETQFFRNEAQFQALRAHVFPDLIERRKHLRTLRIWSAGCATGEEPYSIAILLTELMPDIAQWSISILATDINPQFLSRARDSLYGGWSFRETSDSLRERFFTPEQGRWRLHAEIRRMVTFARLNLVEDSYPALTNGTSALDIIICRNVTIYFDGTTTRQVVERFYSALVPGGWLLVGHSEPQSSTYHQFETHNFPNAIFYRKSLDAPLFALRASAKPPPSAASNTDTRLPVSPALPLTSPTNETAAYPTIGPTALQTNILGTPPRSDTIARRSTVQAMPLPALPPETPGSSGSDWSAIAERLACGDKARGESLLHELLQREPGHVEALVALARLYADRADWIGARQVCDTALEHAPLSVEATYLLAQIYEHQKQLDEALITYRRVLYIDRYFVPGILGMANLWRQMGRFAEARRSYRNLFKYLSSLPSATVIDGTEGATVQELMTFVMHQLEILPPH